VNETVGLIVFLFLLGTGGVFATSGMTRVGFSMVIAAILFQIGCIYRMRLEMTPFHLTISQMGVAVLIAIPLSAAVYLPVLGKRDRDLIRKQDEARKARAAASGGVWPPPPVDRK